MYITQTYLGFVATNAKVYVYFLSEEYMSNQQKDLHDVFLKRAAELGLSTGSDIAVVLPVRGCEMNVLGDLDDEVGSPLQKFYSEKIRNELPGLLVTCGPIDTKEGLSGAIFFSFNTANHPFRAAKDFIQDILKEPQGGKFINFLSGLNEVVILHPNFYGVGVNVNAIIEKSIEEYKIKRNAK